MNNVRGKINTKTSEDIWGTLLFMCSNKMYSSLWKYLNNHHWALVENALNGIVSLNFTR